jgi:hypothetical protein
MKYKAYCTTLILFMLFQYACSNSKSEKSKKNTDNKIASTAHSKTKHQQLVNISDTSISKIDSLSDETFPVIMIGMPDKEAAFKQVKKWGVTHVHRYGMGRSIENDQAFFDRAERHGLKVMSDLRAKYWVKKSKDIDLFQQYIAHFKKHPALGFWYLSDEPNNKGIKPNKLNPLYQILKEETPDIPVANAHAWTEDWYKYGKVQDILMYDYYPVSGESFPKAKLNAWTSFTESAVNKTKRDNDLVIPILQIFSWKAFANEGQEKYRNYAVEKLRYPNTNELRYMFFSSIALGARGVALFSYGRAHMVNPQWGGKVLVPVLREAKEFANQVHDIHKQNVYSVKDQKIFLTRWIKGNDEFIILANATPNERKLSLNIETDIKGLKEFKPWGQTRKTVNLSLSEAQLAIDKIMPWEIIVLKRY